MGPISVDNTSNFGLLLCHHELLAVSGISQLYLYPIFIAMNSVELMDVKIPSQVDTWYYLTKNEHLSNNNNLYMELPVSLCSDFDGFNFSWLGAVYEACRGQDT